MSQSKIVLDNPPANGESPLIVAELSANHGNSLQTALDTVRAVAAAGADAIKLQTYTPGIVFEASFERLGILYLKTVDVLSGQFDVLVDGERVATLNADFSGGWGNCADAREVFVGDGVEQHTVEIRKAADSTGDLFTILGLMVAQ